jgi:hypothetical protein
VYTGRGVDHRSSNDPDLNETDETDSKEPAFEDSESSVSTSSYTSSSFSSFSSFSSSLSIVYSFTAVVCIGLFLQFFMGDYL